jgi:hypothetical protein
MHDTKPPVSIVVVSDYGDWTDDGWNDLRATLAILREQASDENAEVLLVDALPAERQMSADLEQALPSLRVIRSPGATAQELLNEAVRVASAELVVVLDGDCAPAPGWLRAGVAAMLAKPDAAAVSGRTAYPQTSFSYRVLGLLSRSFLDPGEAGPTRFVSDSNAIFRRDVLLAHPLPPLHRRLAARLQGEAIRSAGGAFYFEPRMRVTHRFEGWPMERRIRRNVGYRTIRLRLLDPRLSHAWMVRLGIGSIPLIVAARTLDSCWDCLRVGRHYGLRWFELPAAFATALAVHLLEIGGMAAAFAEARSTSDPLRRKRYA